MNWKRTLPPLVALLAGTTFLGAGANAQHPQLKSAAGPRVNSTYNVANEMSVQGTVLKYTENFNVAPFGAHLLVQTAGGTVDVQAGSGVILRYNKMTFPVGSSVRVIGQYLANGDAKYFAARLIQQGTQVVAVRSTNGFVIQRVPESQVTPESAKQEGAH